MNNQRTVDFCEVGTSETGFEQIFSIWLTNESSKHVVETIPSIGLRDGSPGTRSMCQMSNFRRTKTLGARYSASALMLPIAAALGIAFSIPASAQVVASADSGQRHTDAQATSKKKKTAKKDTNSVSEDRAVAARAALGLPADFKLSDSDIAQIEAMSQSVARLNKRFNIKGMDIPYPGFEDSVFQDYGGFRSALAEYGFGVVANTTIIGAFNTLSVPRSGIGPTIDTGRASNQQYWGQKPSGLSISTVYLTYDLSRWGVPDGQFVVAGVGSLSSWEPYTPNQIGLGALSWYQTLFDKKLEIKVGYIANSVEWIGTAVGGNIASPLGSAAAVPFEMGLSAAPAAQPTARVTWHINDVIYNQAGILRSLPINGPTLNPIYDNAIYNPAGVDFNVPNGGMLLMDEFGLKIPALPGIYGTWLRGGVMYNDSTFINYENGGTTSGITAGYIAGDVQLLQLDPSSLFTAYRGLYVGGSAMWGPESNLAFNEYYEARMYILGPFSSRPKDQFSLVYNYNGVSKYARDLVNQYSGYTSLFANTTSQSYMVTYTGHMAPGVYATVGLSYTENPSLQFTRDEGSSLNLLFSLFMNL